MNFPGSPYGAPYIDPSSYGRVLPRPTSSGTLENDVKRQRVDRPYSANPYYVQPYAQPAPYYQQTNVSGNYWNQSYYPGTMGYMPPQTQPEVQMQKPVQRLTQEPSKQETEQDENDDGSGNEENEPGSGHSEPNGSAILGTSITLTTDEDIAKWREERKKMWLLKISNRRQEHMQRMGIKEDDLKGRSVLQESKKQKQFIQSIQNQVNRTNPKANLNVKIVQREMAGENSQLLDFITELGDAHLLEYELTPEEKTKLFGPPEDKPKFHSHTSKKNYTRKRPYN